MKKTILISTLAINSFIYSQAPGTLDNTFGNGGIEITSVCNNGVPKCLAIQSDGKIVVAGRSDCAIMFTPPYTAETMSFVRYNANGTKDPTFGSFPMGSFSGMKEANAMSIQPDGKIVVAGKYNNSASNYNSNWLVLRFNSNGSQDLSFGTNGQAIVIFGSSDEIATSLALQPDGKIVVAGQIRIGSDNKIGITRFNPNGTLDNSFGVSGKVISSISQSDDYSKAIALQADGKIVITGFTNSTSDICTLRYNANGTLDNGFGIAGIAVTSVGNNTSEEAYAIDIQNDQKIVVSGKSAGVITTLRYNTNGSLDNSFNGNGIVITPIGSNDGSNGVKIQPDGKIVVGGYVTYGSSYYSALIRYNSNGSIDTGFGNGIVINTTDALSIVDGFLCGPLALQADGKIVMVAPIAADVSDFEIMRYNGGTINTSIRNENKEIQKMSVYPNPTKGQLKIENSFYEGNQHFVITNVVGQKVFEFDFVSNISDTIDVSFLGEGLYFLKNTEALKSTLFVKE